jgi:hypothetical protein
MNRLALVLVAAVSAVPAEEITAAAIMERVAENQSRSVEARTRWTHHQETFVRLKRTNGKTAREERREYTVVPTGSGVKKELTLCAGTYEKGGKYIPYDTPGFEHKGVDIDAELADEFADEMFNNGTKDGLDKDLFPFTREQQANYNFSLLGRERYKDRDVWSIAFKPKTREMVVWAGEALIDTNEFQPVLVTTHMSNDLPMWVKTVFGISLKHLGFKVEYRKLEDGVWFPERYGGEFYLRALFLYRRDIAVSMRNSDFRKTDVSSTIEYALTQ